MTDTQETTPFTLTGHQVNLLHEANGNANQEPLDPETVVTVAGRLVTEGVVRQGGGNPFAVRIYLLSEVGGVVFQAPDAGQAAFDEIKAGGSGDALGDPEEGTSHTLVVPATLVMDAVEALLSEQRTAEATEA